MSLEMNLKIILERAIKDNASDVFIVAGLPVSFRTNGTINHVTEEKLFPQHTEALLNDIYELAGHRSMEHLHTLGDDDFSFAIQGLSRFRVSAYKQRGSLSAVIRIITFDLPDYTALGIPEHVMQLTDTSKGMILVTGPAGSGKSTTLACMINQINNTQQKHIITLEDPLEYLHQHKKSIVSQREIQIDTENYVSALRAALRQSPDVILLGEMRDYETINVAMTASETGHLLLSTLHTIGAANTVDRIIDVLLPSTFTPFPETFAVMVPPSITALPPSSTSIPVGAVISTFAFWNVREPALEALASFFTVAPKELPFSVSLFVFPPNVTVP